MSLTSRPLSWRYTATGEAMEPTTIFPEVFCTLCLSCRLIAALSAYGTCICRRIRQRCIWGQHCERIQPVELLLRGDILLLQHARFVSAFSIQLHEMLLTGMNTSLAEMGYNVVLQDNETVTNDGSLSYYAGLQGIACNRYETVHAPNNGAPSIRKGVY